MFPMRQMFHDFASPISAMRLALEWLSTSTRPTEALPHVRISLVRLESLLVAYRQIFTDPEKVDVNKFASVWCKKWTPFMGEANDVMLVVLMTILPMMKATAGTIKKHEERGWEVRLEVPRAFEVFTTVDREDFRKELQCYVLDRVSHLEEHILDHPGYRCHFALP